MAQLMFERSGTTCSSLNGVPSPRLRVAHHFVAVQRQVAGTPFILSLLLFFIFFFLLRPHECAGNDGRKKKKKKSVRYAGFLLQELLSRHCA